MAAGFPPSRQAPQPEQTTQPPPASNTRRQQVPHGLQPQPKAAATFSPASSRSECRQSRPEAIHRPLVLPRLPERPRPDPLTPGRHSRSRQCAGPRPRRPRRSALSLLLFFEKASPTQPCGYEPLKSRSSATTSTACSGPGCPVVLLEVKMHPDPGFNNRLAAQTYRYLVS